MNVRHKARTRVHIRPEGSKGTKMCSAVNLSTTGVAITTEGMALPLGMICELSFAINLGSVIKIHKRFGRVVHIHKGVTGFLLEPYGAKVVEFRS